MYMFHSVGIALLCTVSSNAAAETGRRKLRVFYGRNPE
jgi:hypothetical protein